ncbi:hypothetical protein EST38_g13878 [Candolleomyces aberdarensis]|uniref:Uncharacterized protein n=1 Tax=Candolleomyces aberdarensis TaxID=2316362 RepID=A0A4Q2CYQ5_9AGAR|nr:hypothetical protein EST38_g13878 [Candolleomyces aberdarensis]
MEEFLARYPALSAVQEQLVQGNSGDGEGNDDQPSEVVEDDHQADLETPRQPPDPRLPKPKAIKKFVDNIVSVASAPNEDPEVMDSLYKSITAAILAHFSDVLNLDRTHIDTSATRAAKRMLFDLLIRELKDHPEKREALKECFDIDTDDNRLRSSDALLGKDMMDTVWKDMDRIRLPSWITPAPYDWGTVRRGKLSADNWRIICCIHLPITLIRFFGFSEGRTKDLLDNFMDLVSAVRLATMRRSSPVQIAEYNRHIIKYTKGTLKLFPEYSVLPSHHAALHIGDMLQQFGPKHAHDSPHYKRYIHFFHHMNTNHKIGELEGTFIRTAAHNANLLSLINDSDVIQQRVNQALDPFQQESELEPVIETFGNSLRQRRGTIQFQPQQLLLT